MKKNKIFGEVEILYYNDTVDIIYEACTACYDNTKNISYEEKKEYIQKRVSCGHDSVLEHGFLSFIIHDIKTNIFTEALLEVINHSHYLYIYSSQNEDESWNVMIGGSIRAYKSLIKEFINDHLDDSSDIDNFILNHIINTLHLTTVKEFYCDINNALIDSRKFLDIPFELNEIRNVYDSWGHNNLEVDNIKILDYPCGLNNIYSTSYRYGFLENEVNNIIPVTVLFSNMSRTATHQLVRHRNAITQESQRYVNSSNAKFTTPDMRSYMKDYKEKRVSIDIFGNKTNTTLDILGSELIKIYDQLVNQGLKKEDARAFLPSNVQCKRLYMTFTINSLNKFLELRTDPHAQTEIRSYALDIKYLLDK